MLKAMGTSMKITETMTTKYENYGYENYENNETMMKAMETAMKTIKTMTKKM